MTAIRTCGTHGYFDGDRCPECGDAGKRVQSSGRRRRLSKFLSGLLRHFPDEYGLDLGTRGWADRGAVDEAVSERYDWADGRAVGAVVGTDPKGRFEYTGGRIRAAYGHSVDVTLADTDEPVPDTLYHGTAPSNVGSILDGGLRPMGRQLVHLSASVADAREVGARHAEDPVVLVVDAGAMLAEGRPVTRRGEAVYTTEAVPPRHLRRRE
ncbi:RNA 2'-phosphotransferase [Halobellus ruber]|uniref:Probable RNA 2'-phosphotransferase n=1 Tax=Halobellus ruber TaxID=2761102 RepID=A0A7J9SD02_9EURY|nr:RNA 2'-phosphotransferase [Halobellus ruber]MBB6644794.1 RNA 2'-phosphotransferase [Halobellus ruber]